MSSFDILLEIFVFINVLLIFIDFIDIVLPIKANKIILEMLIDLLFDNRGGIEVPLMDAQQPY